MRRWVAGGLILATVACTGAFDGADTGQLGPGFAGGHPSDPSDPGAGDPNAPRRGGDLKRGKRAPRQGNPGNPGNPGERRPGRAPEEDPVHRGPVPDPKPAEPGGKGIVYLGDDRWQVERSRLDAWTNDPEKLGAGVGKKGSGYQITGVRPGSDAEALGAEEGDVLQEVNGLSLGSQTDLLQLWASVGSEDQFRVKLTRDGQSKTQHYEIVR